MCVETEIYTELTVVYFPDMLLDAITFLHRRRVLNYHTVDRRMCDEVLYLHMSYHKWRMLEDGEDVLEKQHYPIHTLY